MYFLAIRVNVFYKQLKTLLLNCFQTCQQWQVAFTCLLLRKVNYRLFLLTLRAIQFFTPVSRQEARLSVVAKENKRCLLGKTRGVLNYPWINQRRRLLELAATYGRNKALLQELQRCSEQLNSVVKPLHDCGSPVILAPLHMVSDVLAGIVGSQVYPEHSTVVVSSSAQAFEPGKEINLRFCSIHNENHQIASELINAIAEAAQHKTNIMLFPDITPDFTHQYNISATAKFDCQLFGRAARIHSGIIRLARMLSAKVVFYHLYYDNGVKIKIYPAVDAKDIEEQAHSLIEHAIKSYSDEWLLWHTHSLFFFNE